MSPVSGQPANANDVWFRVLTDPKYWKRDGKLHNSAFGGKAISPPKQPKGYTLELSGRLLSLTIDVEAEAKEYCTAPREYSGIMYQTVQKLRTNGTDSDPIPGCPTDVIYTPNADTAHADLVAYGPTFENRYLIRDWLQEFIQCARPGHCGTIEALRRA